MVELRIYEPDDLSVSMIPHVGRMLLHLTQPTGSKTVADMENIYF